MLENSAIFALLGAGAVFAFAVFSRKPRKVILRLGPLSWTRNELCRHFLITGDTGSGKTTSGFQPVLIQITKNEPNWGGLVLGVKGDEHRFISQLLNANGRHADLIHLQVRPETESTRWNPPHRFNLVGNRNLPWMTHAKAIVDLSASMTEGPQHAFFRPMAQLTLANAFELLEEAEVAVTIKNAYQLITDREYSSGIVKKFSKGDATEKQRKLAAFFSSTIANAKA